MQSYNPKRLGLKSIEPHGPSGMRLGDKFPRSNDIEGIFFERKLGC